MPRDLDLDLNLGSDNMAYASLVDLSTYQISFELEKFFVDGRTDGWMDRWTDIEADFISSRPKNKVPSSLRSSVQLQLLTAEPPINR